MKLVRIIILSVLFAGAVCSAQAKNRKPRNHILVLSVKRDIFYFKVDAEFIGSTAMVFDSDGVVQYSTEVLSKHGLIDFLYLKPGTYTIRFSHGDLTEEHQYVVGERG